MFFKKTKTQELPIACPYIGKLIKLADVQDTAFSSKAIGDGIAVELTDGAVAAPVGGTIEVRSAAKHVYCIKDEDGIEYFLHVGIDTSTLNGEGFESFVELGDVVKQGDMLCKVDLDFLKSKNISNVSIFLITNKEITDILEVETVEHKTMDIFKIKA